jgi:hypothetical protein
LAPDRGFLAGYNVDAQQTWSHKQLVEMDRAFVEAVTRAINQQKQKQQS